MAAQDLPGGDGPPPHGCPPAGFPVTGPGPGRQVDLAEDDVDHPVEQVALAGDVVVQRHRLHAERLPQLAHAERGHPGLVGEGYRGAQHPVPVQRRPVRRAVPGGVHPRSPSGTDEIRIDGTYIVSIAWLTV